ncbi:MAG TPA: EAL domain-containing protein [Actinobacteria bacterium]|nr:putative membrane protein YjcC [bacterium BMS3Bbin01]HDH26607.1 EAL domain-containing protein [Actinomycetota bacterium]
MPPVTWALFSLVDPSYQQDCDIFADGFSGCRDSRSEADDRYIAIDTMEQQVDVITHQSAGRRVASPNEFAGLVHEIVTGSKVTMVFQPIFDLRERRDGGRSPIGVEALARFGIAGSPQLVFDAAERMGLGVELEIATLRSALAYLDRLPAGMFLSVNVSATALASGRIAEAIPAQVAERVVLDLVAGGQAVDASDEAGFDRLVEAISDMRQAGIRVALDDVAVAPEAVSNLVLLPFDILKLDRAVVNGIDADAAKQASAKAIVDLAETLGVPVMAEAIETEEEAATLVEQGVLFGQGFHLGRPAVFGAWREAQPATSGESLQWSAAGHGVSESDGQFSREGLLGFALDRAPLVVWAIDADGVFTLSEGGALAALGIEPGEVVGRSVFELYAGNASVLEPTRAALRGEASESVMRVGSSVFGASYAPLRDAEGQVIGASGVAVNITDSVRAREEAHRSEERRLALFETAPVGIWVGTADGRLIEVNDRYLDMFDLDSKQEALSFDLVRLWPSPAHRARFRDRLRRESVIAGFETELVSAKGRPILARVSARYLAETDEMEGMVEDITAEAAARAAVADSERRFRTLFESAPIALQVEDFTDVVAWLDGLDVASSDLPDYFDAHPEKVVEGLGLIEITNANPAAAQLFGLKQSRLLGPLSKRSALPAFTDPDAFLLRSIANRVATFERRVTAEISGKGLIDLEIRWTAPNRGGRPDYSQVIAAFVDVTALVEATRRAQELAEIKGRLIGSVSHELRTPLAAVVGFADLLEGGQSSLSETETAEAIHLIASTSRQMGGIVEDLLTSARTDVGILATAPTLINLADEAKTALTTCDTQNRQVHIPATQTQAWADKGRTRQIIRNLINNAIRHGSGDIHVEIAANDHRAILRVIDHGNGVPNEDADKMFDMYWSGHDAPGHTNSLGIGLSLSRTLAQLMRGDLTYHRKDGKTIFEFTLPTPPTP